MANKMVCRFCGAKFDEMLPKCPFCGCTNYKGAEAEYFEKLEDVREDMEDLEEVPEEETKKAFREQGKFLKKVFLIIVVLALLGIAWKIFMDRLFERDEKADFFWKQENFPIMDEMYEQGKYDELVAFFQKACEGNAPIWEWEHADFCDLYETILYLQDVFAKEAEGEELSEEMYAGILFDEWLVIGMSMADLDEQERAILAEYESDILKDFEERWDMSEEDYQAFYYQLEENRGWVTYKSCEEYVENRYNER